MKVYTKGILESASLKAANDYPDEYGEYWVIRYNEETEEIERIERLEFVPIDEEYPSMYDGWQDIQYEVENPGDLLIRNITYYWTKELTLK